MNEVEREERGKRNEEREERFWVELIKVKEY